MAVLSEIETELYKLKKDILIDIILNKAIPPNVVVTIELRKHISYPENRISDVISKISNTSEQKIDKGIDALKNDLKCSNIELQYSSPSVGKSVEVLTPTPRARVRIPERTSLILGVNEDIQESTSAPKRAWICLGKVAMDVTKEQIMTHLKKVHKREDFFVEPLTVPEGAKSTSFKIGANFSIMKNLYDGKKWPSGVSLRRFSFFRDQRGTSFQ
ncbi:hypothetical protein HHI36_016503 [Cryptolaemus montrouzieri]|uniref:Uncharacterized protein n=1 Tax=Cryptolaemus montrouzieri TaxID=559131 RepID=A0ABD2NJP2_9CUCU